MMSPPFEHEPPPSESPDPGPPVSAHWALAEEKLSPGAHGYFFGGAGSESTLRANERSFSSILFRPRVLVDVKEIDMSTNLHPTLPLLPFPLLIAPMALQMLAHPRGELATASAAAVHGIPIVLSMFSSVAVERVAALGAPVLQHLCMLRDRDITLRIAHRAKAAGAVGLVLTGDTPVSGHRRRGEDMSFALPAGVEPVHLVGTSARLAPARDGRSALAEYGRNFLDPSTDMDALRWLVREAGLPVWVKGVLRGDDAAAAVAAGAAGIFVSNHGGRQLDGAVCAVDALEEVVRAVAGSVPVIVDSGVRTPEDVVKALALGARAAMVGRPVLAALAADGDRGVRKLLKEWKEGIHLAMALSGAKRCSDVDRSLVVTVDERMARAVQTRLRAKL